MSSQCAILVALRLTSAARDFRQFGDGLQGDLDVPLDGSRPNRNGRARRPGARGAGGRRRGGLGGRGPIHGVGRAVLGGCMRGTLLGRRSDLDFDRRRSARLLEAPDDEDFGHQARVRFVLALLGHGDLGFQHGLRDGFGLGSFLFRVSRFVSSKLQTLLDSMRVLVSDGRLVFALGCAAGESSALTACSAAAAFLMLSGSF
jgi:hypothetical protein